MKLIIRFFALTLLVFTACKQEKKQDTVVNLNTKEVVFASFGDKITSDKALTSAEMFEKFKTLKAGDTLNVKFASKIKEVCTKKGCWMKLPLGEETETMVRFKDYGFFMPLDSKDSEVIVEGKAYVTETSVNDLRHYAEDAGKTAGEIAKITEPKREFAFEAHGVLMNN